jgi:hypothetical protein
VLIWGEKVRRKKQGVHFRAYFDVNRGKVVIEKRILSSGKNS